MSILHKGFPHFILKTTMFHKHIKCRDIQKPYLSTTDVYRQNVPDEKIDWNINFPDYNPTVYTDSRIFGKAWADPENGIFLWNSLDGNVDRRSHIKKYDLNERGWPLNPMGRTGICGRGILGRWGPNHAADPIVSRFKNGQLQFIAIQRHDTGEWAIPGGMVDPGEEVSKTLKREFTEEALNNVECASLESLWSNGIPIYKGYVDDPRNTDNAWMETSAVNFHDDKAVLDNVIFKAGDDAACVKFVDVGPKLDFLQMHSGSPTIVGNVQFPSQRPQRGNLIFDAAFESGNLGRVDSNSLYEYDLFIRPDTCNPKYRVWFYFAVQNMQQNQRVVFNVVNFSKPRSLFDKGCAAPVYREAMGSEFSEWYSNSNYQVFRNRISVKNIYYYRSQPHGDRFILSFVHIFRNSVRVEFAYCIPYTYSQLQEFLRRIDSRRLNYFRRDPLCLTVQKRRVDLLTITAGENMSLSRQRIVFITARVHPGETPSSHVLEGFLEFLLSEDKKARKLRSLYVFKVVPMLNPDGVYLGNYRCSLMGFDLNRQWQHPSVWAHPTIAATKHLLLQFNTNPNTEVCLCFDLHAHSQQTNSFLYGNLSATSPRRCDRQLFIPYILADITDDYSLQSTQFNTDIDKAGTNRRAMGELLDSSCLCYTLEVSFFSFRSKDLLSEKATPYLVASYRLLGLNLAIAILTYTEVLNDEKHLTLSRSFETFLPKRCIRSFRLSQRRSNRSSGRSSSTGAATRK